MSAIRRETGGIIFFVGITRFSPEKGVISHISHNNPHADYQHVTKHKISHIFPTNPHTWRKFWRFSHISHTFLYISHKIYKEEIT